MTGKYVVPLLLANKYVLKARNIGKGGELAIIKGKVDNKDTNYVIHKPISPSLVFLLLTLNR